MKSILLIFLILTVWFTGFSQDSLNLADALRIGLENNFQIRIADKNLEIAQNNNSLGTAGLYPYVSLGLTVPLRYDNSEPTSELLPRESSLYGFTPNIMMQWTLFQGLSVWITKDKLEFLEQLSEGNAAVLVENTIQAIVLGYYNALLEQEKLSVIHELLELSKDRYEYMSLKKELGNVTSFELLQSKTAFLSDSSTYLLQQMNYKNSIRNLNLLMGKKAKANFLLTDEFEFVPKDYALEDMIAQMMANNKTLKNQYINLEIIKKDVELTKTALYPTVSLTSGADYNKNWYKLKGFDAIDSYSYDLYANISLSYTIFNGGNIKSAIQNAKIQEEIGQLQLEEIQIKMINQISSIWDFYTIRKQLFNVALENLAAAKLNLDIAKEKYEAGAINSFNYRDIQIAYLNAAFNELEALYNLMDSHTELMRLTGNIISEYEQ